MRSRVSTATRETYRAEVTLRDPFDRSNPYLSLEEIREEVGLFDDTTHDQLLREYASAAVERVSAETGQVLTAVPVKDLFPAPVSSVLRSGYYPLAWCGQVLPCDRPRLRLSQLQVQTVTSVSAYLGDDTSRTVLTEEADWFLDSTVQPAHIVMERREDWSTRYVNPVEVAYTPAGVNDDFAVFQEQVRQAIRYLISVYFEARGTSALPAHYEKGLISILGPAARVWV